jgi:hypothetical protein
VDIDDSWEEVEVIMDYFAEKQDKIAEHAGPGHWNDPDMVCSTFIKQIFLPTISTAATSAGVSHNIATLFNIFYKLHHS